MGSSWRHLAVIAFAALATGCAVTPQARHELTAYAEAMQQVEASAQGFLSDFAAGLQAQEARAAAARAPAAAAPERFPASFEPAAVAAAGAAMPETAATLQALAVVRAYDQLLLTLAEGRPESALRSGLAAAGAQVQALGTLVGASALPALGPAIGVLAQVLKAAQDARNREQLVQAVVQGRAPVDEILATLAAQARPLYALTVVQARQELTALRNEIRAAAFSLGQAARQHAPPTDPAIQAAVAELQDALDRAGRATDTRGALPLPLPYAGSRPFDASALELARVLVRAIGGAAGRFDAVVARQNAGHASLQKYVAAIAATRTALARLEQSLQQPTDLRAEAMRLFKVAFDLRDSLARDRAAQPAP